jgi:hypothetical protein
MSIARTPHPRLLFALFAFVVSACGNDAATEPAVTGFLAGTSNNHEIGLVVNSTGKAITLFQLGNSSVQTQIALGTSSTVSPVAMSLRGRRAAVPLGDAGSIALLDLQGLTVQRFFTFASGNATGSVFVDDTTIVAANTTTATVGRMTLGQSSASITSTAKVAPAPTAISFAAGRVLVTSANLDANFTPIGNSIVTAVDPKTMQVIAAATTGGTNANDAAVGPDGLLYVVNTGDFVSSSTLTIVDPASMQVVTTVPNIGAGAGAITIDAAGLAYISSFVVGTVVWNTRTRAFVRGPDNPVCAKVAGVCRGAFSAAANQAGDLYQVFFGSSTKPPYVFVYKAGSFTLTDSISVGVGPTFVAIRSF